MRTSESGEVSTQLRNMDVLMVFERGPSAESSNVGMISGAVDVFAFAAQLAGACMSDIVHSGRRLDDETYFRLLGDPFDLKGRVSTATGFYTAGTLDFVLKSVSANSPIEMWLQMNAYAAQFFVAVINHLFGIVSGACITTAGTILWIQNYQNNRLTKLKGELELEKLKMEVEKAKTLDTSSKVISASEKEMEAFTKGFDLATQILIKNLSDRPEINTRVQQMAEAYRDRISGPSIIAVTPSLIREEFKPKFDL